jgi:hypothetical protein
MTVICLEGDPLSATFVGEAEEKFASNLFRGGHS